MATRGLTSLGGDSLPLPRCSDSCAVATARLACAAPVEPAQGRGENGYFGMSNSSSISCIIRKLPTLDGINNATLMVPHEQSSAEFREEVVGFLLGLDFRDLRYSYLHCKVQMMKMPSPVYTEKHKNIKSFTNRWDIFRNVCSVSIIRKFQTDAGSELRDAAASFDSYEVPLTTPPCSDPSPSSPRILCIIRAWTSYINHTWVTEIRRSKNQMSQYEFWKQICGHWLECNNFCEDEYNNPTTKFEIH